MKNIIIISNIQVFKGNTAAASRLRNYARALALGGNNKVLICSAISNYKIDINKQLEVQEKISEISQKSFMPNLKFLGYNNNFLFLLSFFRNVNKLINKLNNKAVVLIYPSKKSSLELLCLLYLKILKKRKVYYEANEVRKYILNNTLYSNNFTKRIIQYLLIRRNRLKYQFTDFCTKYYNGIIAISINIERYYKKYNKNIIRVPILSNTDIKPFKKHPSFNYNTDDYFNICFTGSIFLKKEGFDILFQALSDLQKRNFKIKLHLYGLLNGANKNLLLNVLAKKLKIENNVIYHGVVKPADLICEMQKYHLLILTRPNTLQAKYGFSTKLSEYLVSGVPVLLTDVSDNAYYIKDGVNGYLIPPSDVNAIRNKLSDIIQNYNKNVEKVVYNAFDTAKKEFQYSNYSKVLSQFLN